MRNAAIVVGLIAAIGSATGCNAASAPTSPSDQTSNAGQKTATGAENNGIAERISAYLAAKPALDRSTPDRAVQSWWALRDWEDGLNDAIGCGYVAPHLKGYVDQDRAAKNEILSGSLKRQFERRYDCAQEKAEVRVTHYRSIVEVKMETATRAVVQTIIKNSTPIPENVSLSADDLKNRDFGQPTKYILTTDGAGWSIEQAFYEPAPIFYDHRGNPQYLNGEQKGSLREFLPEADNDDPPSTYYFEDVQTF